ncbi:hypothetical protein HF086_003847 [Spodoptera exigua]|uniref:Reverse transcriptase domain-containing protein n=1 Tax=Spodoptera exigua TaxID=7107 RepID=A0A922MM87_SPOEX|nr:hypothetical protein HF086_003847 [Spodoptera exigua]
MVNACTVNQIQDKESWYVDNGATTHIAVSRKMFTDFREFDSNHTVTTADGTVIPAVGIGSIKVESKDATDTTEQDDDGEFVDAEGEENFPAEGEQQPLDIVEPLRVEVPRLEGEEEEIVVEPLRDEPQREEEPRYNLRDRLYGPRKASVGVCQGGILSPLIFILYIRRLNLILASDVKSLQFADDLVVYASGKDMVNVANILNKSLKGLNTYFSYLNLDVNALKSKLVVFGKKNKVLPCIYYNKVQIPFALEAKFLGVTFTHNLSWNKYIELICGRANRAFNVLKSLCRTSWGADPKILLILYKSLIRSHFEYGFLCFAADSRLVDKLEKIQNKSMRLITGGFKSTPINSMQVECNLPPFVLDSLI